VPRNIHLLVVFATLTGSTFGQIWQREVVDFPLIQSRAKALAAKPYAAPDRDSLPAWMTSLTYDQYRDIRFNPDQALWTADDSPFRAMFFHPGYQFREPVILNEFTGSHQQRIRSTEAFFNYGSLVPERGEFPANCGFAGFRLHAPLNRPNVFDELIVLQGASYWRALGKGQRYGLSARGVAIDTGVDGTKEEFPAFREFWLGKPAKGDSTAVFYGLLDGPSCAGAYAFEVKPGEDTTVSVQAVLFARQSVKRLGIAPMSSMYWFGENSRRRFDDFRPEVHDSDGLSIHCGNGERIWRPLANDTGNLEFSFFNMDECAGFGLLQRDRRFAAFEDGEAAYHLRPSLWIEPTSDWGPGRVVLMEIPATSEVEDNVVAMWEPATTPQPGGRVEFSYKQHWTMATDPAGAGGHVVATRTGVHKWQPEQRTIIVEFAGGALDKLGDKGPEPMVQILGDGAAKAKIQGTAVQPMGPGHWRLAFQIAPAAEGGKLAEVGALELRACLKQGDDYLTETWASRIIP
jgi:glucans biosynthesis protein